MPEESYTIPFGEANVVREGKRLHHRDLRHDGASRHGCGRRRSPRKGIECEVIDLRTLSPIDWDTVLDSVEKTGRLVCVDEAHPRCSIASRRLGQGRAGGLQVAEGRHPDGDGAAHAGAVLAGARGSLHPERGADRRGRPARPWRIEELP